MARPVGKMLSTPGGKPASRNNSASARVLSGVRGAGLSRTEHPATSAGISRVSAVTCGAVEGSIAASTPVGALTSAAWAAPDTPAATSSRLRTACNSELDHGPGGGLAELGSR